MSHATTEPSRTTTSTTTTRRSRKAAQLLAAAPDTTTRAPQRNRNVPIICPNPDCRWSGRTYRLWIGEGGDDLPVCDRKVRDEEGNEVLHPRTGQPMRCGTKLVVK
jgi:hypothetical protein